MTGWELAANYGIAALVGGLVGLAELIARYKDAPSRVLRHKAGWFYIAINAAAAIAALFLILVFNVKFGQTGKAQVALQVLAAGMGSAVIFRSNIFLATVGDQTVGVGPSLLLTNFLSAADRSVDRDQATHRIKSAGSIMADVDFNKARGSLVATCLAAVAAVSAGDASNLRTAVQALHGDTDIPDVAKSLVLGLLLIDVVGVDVLKEARGGLGAEIQ